MSNVNTTIPFTTPPQPTTTYPATNPVPVNSNATTLPPIILVGPAMIQSTSTVPPWVVGASTVASGIFGVGANFDPLIIFALVVAGLLVLVLLGAFIYCCCAYCGVPTRQELEHTSSIRSVRSVRSVPAVRSVRTIRTIRQEPTMHRPVYLSASFTPEYPYSVEEPAASVMLEQPVHVSMGAYAVGDGTSGGLTTGRIIGSYPRRIRQQTVDPDVIVTRAAPVQMRNVRKKYLYPSDVIGSANDITYHTSRPAIVTTLGDGYAVGHSLRSSGNRYGRRSGSVLLYDDDASDILGPSRIITLN